MPDFKEVIVDSDHFSDQDNTKINEISGFQGYEFYTGDQNRYAMPYHSRGKFLKKLFIQEATIVARLAGEEASYADSTRFNFTNEDVIIVTGTLAGVFLLLLLVTIGVIWRSYALKTGRLKLHSNENKSTYKSAGAFIPDLPENPSLESMVILKSGSVNDFLTEIRSTEESDSLEEKFKTPVNQSKNSKIQLWTDKLITNNNCARINDYREECLVQKVQFFTFHPGRNRLLTVQASDDIKLSQKTVKKDVDGIQAKPISKLKTRSLPSAAQFQSASQLNLEDNTESLYAKVDYSQKKKNRGLKHNGLVNENVLPGSISYENKKVEVVVDRKTCLRFTHPVPN